MYSALNPQVLSVITCGDLATVAGCCMSMCLLSHGLVTFWYTCYCAVISDHVLLFSALATFANFRCFASKVLRMVVSQGFTNISFSKFLMVHNFVTVSHVWNIAKFRNFQFCKAQVLQIVSQVSQGFCNKQFALVMLPVTGKLQTK